MGLRKRCSRTAPPVLPSGAPNPLFCPTSPRCDHVWHHDFHVNRRRYRGSTDTSDKHRARDIEARERARILEERHGIRRQPDITFRKFAKVYLRDHAEVHKRSVGRDREIIARLNRVFGSMVLHEITRHRIEQYKRERLKGKWSAYKQKKAPKSLKPATVNRELDTLKSILSKAVEWGKLIDSPARLVKRLPVENRRTRILTLDEQRRLLKACHPKLRAIVTFALITTARIGEILTLRWDQCDDGFITFLPTKNAKLRRIPISMVLAEVLAEQSRWTPWVFPNIRTKKPYTCVTASFRRALERAKIMTGDVTPHTLRHTAISRMIEAGYDDYTVMAISGHSSTRMLARYTHPTEARKLDALESFSRVTNTSHGEFEDAEKGGGPQGTRTLGLRVANAALSQLS